MRLDLDIGNTFLKWRICSEHSQALRGQVATADIRAGLPLPLLPEGVRSARLACVAGIEVENILLERLHQAGVHDIRVARTQTQAHGLTNSYAHPERMGVDRWLAMQAAWQKYQQPLCVLDCGSALTVDYIDAQGCHEGGYIIPGLQLMGRSLRQETAAVRFVEDVQVLQVQPGRDTAACVTHGALFAQQAVVERVARECLQDKRVLVLTGGDAEQLQASAPWAHWLPELVLDGLEWL